MKELQAQSLKGQASKARVADLLMRENGVPHSEGRTVWMVVDDLLAIDSA
jgi:hypothetical protein